MSFFGVLNQQPRIEETTTTGIHDITISHIAQDDTLTEYAHKVFGSKSTKVIIHHMAFNAHGSSAVVAYGNVIVQDLEDGFKLNIPVCSGWLRYNGTDFEVQQRVFNEREVVLPPKDFLIVGTVYQLSGETKNVRLTGVVELV